jgi:hypothetical protein
MNLSKTKTEDELVITPLFRMRDSIPLVLFAVALVFCVGILLATLVAIPWSVTRKEWLGACTAALFVVLSAWLSRLAARAVLALAPRQLRYSVKTESFEVRHFGVTVHSLRSKIKSLRLKIEVRRGGMHTAPGNWVFLALEQISGRQRLFYLGAVPSLRSAQREEIRELVGELGRFSGVPIGHPKVME